MRLPEFEHLEPKSMVEALEQLSRYKKGSQIIAGGTDVLPSMKQRIKTPGYLIDIKNIPDLRGITFDEKEGLKIGALVTHRELRSHSEIKEKYPILSHAASVIGAPQLQAMGTIGGNLCLDTRCWYYNQSLWWRKAKKACFKLGGDVCHVGEGKKCQATYQGDMAAALIALNARIQLSGPEGEKILPLQDFYTGRGKVPNILTEEILTEVIVPAPKKKSGAHYEKLRLRNAIDFPIVGAAVNISLENGVCQETRVMINAVHPGPQEVHKDLTGKKINKESIQEMEEASYQDAHPVETMPGSPEYRRDMVRVMVKKSFEKALERARGENK